MKLIYGGGGFKSVWVCWPKERKVASWSKLKEVDRKWTYPDYSKMTRP